MNGTATENIYLAIHMIIPGWQFLARVLNHASSIRGRPALINSFSYQLRNTRLGYVYQRDSTKLHVTPEWRTVARTFVRMGPFTITNFSLTRINPDIEYWRISTHARARIPVFGLPINIFA